MISISTFVVAALWVVREITARVIHDTAARIGRVGFIREDASLMERIVRPNGESWDTLYADIRRTKPVYIRYVASGHLFNDADTALLVRDPKVIFWAEDGQRIRHSNPKFVISGEATSVVTVPPHGTVLIHFELSLSSADLDTTYANAIPIVEVDTTSGRFYRFPLSGIPIWRVGDDNFAWDSRRNKVVRSGTTEWIRAQRKRSLNSIEARAGRR